MSVRSLVFILVSCLAAAGVRAQPAPIPDAASLRLDLEKLRVMGSAMLIAAHPDDEDSALLAYWSKGRLVETAYLSMTRGDGGQNLIGSEKGPLIGVLRTQELLAARRVDGAAQLFTRAVDFGYSKSPQETLAIWGKDAVLADTVRAIRAFRPDVVVTIFPTTGEGGHGQHTASALLAAEAFHAAGDPARFPDQLGTLAPWTPKRLLWDAWDPNTQGPPKPAPGRTPADVGAYNAVLGKSYAEIGAIADAMHESQGNGYVPPRGAYVEQFQLLDGDPAARDLFDGVDLTWNRVPGGAEVGRLLDEAVKTFDANEPSRIVPLLVSAYRAMGKLGKDPLVETKRKETLEVIRASAGLWLEAIAKDARAVPGGELKLTASALNRSPLALELSSVEAPFAASVTPSNPFAPRPLERNVASAVELVLRVPESAPYSTPYWLRKPPGKGLYEVENPEEIGWPESPPPFRVSFRVSVAGEMLAFETPVFFRSTDPVRGEQYRHVAVVPAVTAAFDEKQYLFTSEKPAPRRVRVTLRSARPGAAGTLRLVAPDGWKAEPASAPFTLKDAGDETSAAFLVTPPAAESTTTLAAVVDLGGASLSYAAQTLEYPHIPPQTLFPPAQARAVHVAVATRGREIGYVMGSGDEVPGVLGELGYRVTLLSDEDLASSDLSRFDAVVAGVRAYNTRKHLKTAQERLLRYVELGGTYVVQYATRGDLAPPELGPYPFKIGRDRVTVEEAPVAFVKSGHPLLTSPNAITPRDFEGWVQERGLSFADAADARYERVLETHDPGEPPKPDGLLYARYGKGVFVYTGYAFFRQLPAGVPGALRLFANLVSAKGDR
jgi:LmbE family N-acetylglucosaminyl deacetylase